MTDVPTYTTVYTKEQVVDQEKLFGEKDNVMAVFSSASTVRGFASSCPDLDFTKVKAACIGKQTQAEAAKLGMTTYVSKEASMDSLVELICETAAAR